MEAAYRKAKQYASERGSMGKTIDRHEMIADLLDEMEGDIRGLRALAMHGAFHEEMAQKLRLALDHAELDDVERGRLEQERAQHAAEARRTTPLLKYLASEKALEMARRCVQIHGGNGYMQEFGAEKLVRDATVLPIYEGTSQIQSLMVVKDTLGAVLKNPAEFLRRLAQARWRQVSARDPLERAMARMEALTLAAQQHLITKTAGDKVRSLRDRFLHNWDPKRDFAYAMLHAERVTRMLADHAVAEILHEQQLEHPERRWILERHLERAEPRARYLHEQIIRTGKRLLDRLAADEADASRTAAE